VLLSSHYMAALCDVLTRIFYWRTGVRSTPKPGIGIARQVAIICWDGLTADCSAVGIVRIVRGDLWSAFGLPW
jgi:hypothetical protein